MLVLCRPERVKGANPHLPRLPRLPRLRRLPVLELGKGLNSLRYAGHCWLFHPPTKRRRASKADNVLYAFDEVR